MPRCRRFFQILFRMFVLSLCPVAAGVFFVMARAAVMMIKVVAMLMLMPLGGDNDAGRADGGGGVGEAGGKDYLEGFCVVST